MKIIAINGSPRKDGNSAKMLRSWVDGFKYLYPEAEVEWVNLYSLNYTYYAGMDIAEHAVITK